MRVRARGWHGRRGLLVAAATVAFVLAAALAGESLSPSTFESADGNLIVNTAGRKDWCLDFPAPAGACTQEAPSLAKGLEAGSGSTDDSFAGGTKQDDAEPAVGFGSIPPNKDDLTRFYVSNEPVGSDAFLYLAWQRTPSTGGSAHEAFELNQRFCTAGSSTDTDCSGNGVTPKRTDGDLLMLYDFEGGGGPPVISVMKWLTPGGSPGACEVAKAPPCWGNRQSLSSFGNADAAVNTEAVTDPLNPAAPRQLSPFSFGESGINLTAANLFQGACMAFGSAYIVSRSSGNSFKATLKDFIAPIPVNISNCPTPIASSTPTVVPNDSVTITGASSSAGGTVTFSLYPPADPNCSGTPSFTEQETVAGNGTYSTSNTAFTANISGIWRWEVIYSGDSSNASFTVACGSERFEIVSA